MLDQTKTSSMTSTRTKRVLHLLPPSAYSDMCRKILSGKEIVGLWIVPKWIKNVGCRSLGKIVCSTKHLATTTIDHPFFQVIELRFCQVTRYQKRLKKTFSRYWYFDVSSKWKKGLFENSEFNLIQHGLGLFSEYTGSTNLANKYIFGILEAAI